MSLPTIASWMILVGILEGSLPIVNDQCGDLFCKHKSSQPIVRVLSERLERGDSHREGAQENLSLLTFHVDGV